MASKLIKEEEIHDLLEEDQDDNDSDITFDDGDTVIKLLSLLMTTMMVMTIIMTM
jgi:hypothetical protein